MDVKIGMIGGSGLGQAMLEGHEGKRHELDTPFGTPSDAITESTIDGVPVFLLARHGSGHVLNPSAINYRANLFAMKQLGVTCILASGAVGSLRENLRPRQLAIPDQVIDKTSKRPHTFYENAAVHVEFANPFCPVLRKLLLDTAAQSDELKADVHDSATYVCMEGPAFSSRAESLMHRLWGGDMIGMTLMPEAKLAREAEISYAAVCLVTDYDSWRLPPAAKESDAPARPDPFELLNEIIGHLKEATRRGLLLMHDTVKTIAADPSPLADCPAKDALQLAIWSEKPTIDPQEVQRLWPLWGRHFAS